MKKWTVLFPLFSILFLLWIEQGIEVSYVWKTLAKVLVFVVFPVLLLRSFTFDFLQIRKTQKKSIYIALGLGLLVAGTILSTYMLLNDLIDLVALQEDLEKRVGVTASVFPFVAVYILLGNSFLEEFFFRGLLVDLLKESRLKWFLPSLFFAIYHIAIFLPWFEWPILLLAVAGLFIGGLVFQWINEKSGTIYPSWIIHIFADIGVLLIGVYMFYIK
ncbi:CPBP family intramembrane metalloprotease [Paenisporosarcina quisquiliarum]|uniref:CPBP family intramembrane metalloprotease n=1 Tax=Paenisporosarcina quisquiliarum TaxID=365346 RepID=A0A9X3RER9_9BACL|nr:CPBP family intramembrane glutamic endopeptidase [Paenisporosarcina quisquiliarum]MCZ8538169.1 CPBP family intramembrane metalloprotease [Paenisporosarcina quisquiliarum]